MVLGAATLVVPASTGAADDGWTLRPLFTHASDDPRTFAAFLSDDASTLVVQTENELLPDLAPSDQTRVFTIDVASGAIRLAADDWRIIPEAVSPDGKLIVASLQRDDGWFDVGLIDTSGVAHRLLLPESGVLAGVAFSGDGSALALSFMAANQDHAQMFVVDVATGAIDDSLLFADGDLSDPRLSMDGSVLAFSSSANNLPVGPGHIGSDAVVLDRTTGVMSLAYTTDDGDIADEQSVVEAITADGSTVIIRSAARNLGGPRVSTVFMVPYLFDRATGTTTAVVLPIIASVESGFGHPEVIESSADGARLLLDTSESLYVLDRPTGRLADVARPPTGSRLTPVPGRFLGQWMSADGRVVVYIAEAVEAEPGAAADVFVWTATGTEFPGVQTTPPTPQAPPTTEPPPTTEAPPTTEPPTEPQTTEPDRSPGVDIYEGWGCAATAWLPGQPLACPDSDGPWVAVKVLGRMVVRGVLFDEF